MKTTHSLTTMTSNLNSPSSAMLAPMAHLVAKATDGQTPLRDFATARTLWRSLEKTFPDALGAVLMHDHIHLLLPWSMPPAEAPAHAQAQARALRRLGSALSTVSPRVRGWRIAEIQFPSGRSHALRLWRYVMLNPCRNGQAPDPLTWTWSTLRDLQRAAFPTWVQTDRLVRALGLGRLGSRRDAEVWLLDYAYRDESVGAIGSKKSGPGIAPRGAAIEGPSESLEALLTGFSAALRVNPTEALARVSARRAFLRLAVRRGWGRPGLRQAGILGRFCGVSPLTIRRGLRIAAERLEGVRGGDEPDGLVRAAEVCLQDPRLVREMVAWFWRARSARPPDGFE